MGRLDASCGGHLSLDSLIELAEQSDPAPLLMLGAMVLVVIIGPIPTVPISVASGMLFCGAAGFAYAMAGGLIGTAIGLQIARVVGRPLASRLFRGHIAFCEMCSSRLLFWVVFGSRRLPVVPFGAVSYAVDLTAMRISSFLLATVIGMASMTVLYVAVGRSSRSIR